VSSRDASTPHFYIQVDEVNKKCNRVSYNVILISTISLLIYFTYIIIYIIICLEEEDMVFWNLLDGGPSRSRSLFESSESLQGGTPGTNPR
jgi:hypothetical protein